MIFTLGDVLSITTGRFVSTRGVGALYEILNHMTGDNLMTHQLPRAMRECAPWLLRWFPELAVCGTDSALARLDHLIAVDRAQCAAAWLDELRQTFPELKCEYDVSQIPADDHERIDPIEEIARMAPQAKVVVVGL